MEALLTQKDKEGAENWISEERRAAQSFDLGALYLVCPVL